MTMFANHYLHVRWSNSSHWASSQSTATYQNVINCVHPWIEKKPPRRFGSNPNGRSCVHYLAIADGKLLTDFISKDVEITAKECSEYFA
ncbi:hypothetical protein TNCV_4751491 [Trichonephila clavipes]|nr:hypothetical protein TNCV_4751491 [Trichonephila clavipes]